MNKYLSKLIFSFCNTGKNLLVFLALFMVLGHAFIPHHHVEGKSNEHFCTQHENPGFLQFFILAFEQAESDNHLDKVSSSTSNVQLLVKLMALPVAIFQLIELNTEPIPKNSFYPTFSSGYDPVSLSALRGPPAA